MRILLSAKDLVEIVSKHLFAGILKDVAGADVEVGILDGQIVASVAVGEEQLVLESPESLLEPRTGVVGSAPAEPEIDPEPEAEAEEDQAPKRRKRRTKAEIEADEAAAAAAAEEAAVEDDTPPFDIDEGAVVRAEADVLPDTQPTAENAADAEDPFAAMGDVADQGEELFSQGDVPVTPVTETSEAGFAKPTEAEEDPFAGFN